MKAVCKENALLNQLEEQCLTDLNLRCLKKDA